ncbi:hypothetical protein ABZP36_031227 [Zizania latifolia]
MAPAYGAAAVSRPQSPLRITHDGEFYARLLTKESSQGNPSFRYYGAGTGAVPFVWESHPGTPKVVDASSSSCRMLAAATEDVPAITPPPSYHVRADSVSSYGGHSARIKGVRGDGGRSSKYCGYNKLKWIKIGFITAVFHRLALRKSRASSSSLVQPSPSTRWLFSGASSVETRDSQHDYHEAPAPASKTKGVPLFCLGVRPKPWIQFCGARSCIRVDAGSSWAAHAWA